MNNFKKLYESLLTEESQVQAFVDKAISKGMADQKDNTLKDWLKVPELNQKEREKVFDLIRKRVKSSFKKGQR